MQFARDCASTSSVTEGKQSAAQLRPKLSFSPGQGLDSSTTLDFECIAYPKLLRGSWISIAFFAAFFFWCLVFQVRDSLLAHMVLYSALFNAGWAGYFARTLPRAFRRGSGVRFMYNIMHSLLAVTVVFLIIFQFHQVEIFQRQITMLKGHSTYTLEPFGLAVVLASFALLVAYGIFVPDPNEQRTSKTNWTAQDWIRRFFAPRAGVYLNWVLHFVALFPLLVIGILGSSTGTLQHFIGPMCQMAIWLLLGWSIAFFGPMSFDYRESMSLQERINQARYDFKESLGAVKWARFLSYMIEW